MKIIQKMYLFTNPFIKKKIREISLIEKNIKLTKSSKVPGSSDKIKTKLSPSSASNWVFSNPQTIYNEKKKC